jgi:hypothetical protein
MADSISSSQVRVSDWACQAKLDCLFLRSTATSQPSECGKPFAILAAVRAQARSLYPGIATEIVPSNLSPAGLTVFHGSYWEPPSTPQVIVDSKTTQPTCPASRVDSVSSEAQALFDA